MFNSEGPTYLEFLPANILQFGGGSSGGGQSGKVDYPEYMKEWHITMLQGTHRLITNAAASPWPKTYIYDPKVWFGLPTNNSAYTALSQFKAIDIKAIVDNMLSDNPTTSYVLGSAAIKEIKEKAKLLRDELINTDSELTIQTLVDAQATKILQKIDADVIPRIELGLRDVNAVIGSSFIIAKEIAMENYTAEIADYSAKIRLRFWELRHELYKFAETMWIQGSVSSAEITTKALSLYLDKVKTTTGMALELSAAATLAQSKYGVVQTEQAMRDRTWKLDLYDHMNKTLASISGASPISDKSNQGSAAAIFSGTIGMGATGAGVGASIGGPWGAVIGGVAGIGAGLAQGLMSRK